MKRVISDISQWGGLTLLVMDRWQKNKKPFIVSIKAAPKTHEQLGYFHSEVLPKLTIALHEAGEIKNKNEREAKYWLKREINYGEWIEFDGGVVFDPNSFETASTEVLSNAIDTAIYHAAQRGIFIAEPKNKKNN